MSEQPENTNAESGDGTSADAAASQHAAGENTDAQATGASAQSARNEQGDPTPMPENATVPLPPAPQAPTHEAATVPVEPVQPPVIVHAAPPRWGERVADAPPAPIGEPAAVPPVPPVGTYPEGAAFMAPPPRDQRKRRLYFGITGAIVLAALIGGGSGAGIAALVMDNSGTTTSVSSGSSGPQSVTINNSKDTSAVTAVAAKASPSVVTINVTGSTEAGTGSGIVLSKDGYILTNTHVVTLDGEESSPTISVSTNDGKIYSATVVGTDPTMDLAVIKMKNVSGLTPMTFADSDKLNVGSTTVAIGAPLGLSGTVTDGIVSALNRSISVASSAAPSSSDSSDGDSGSSGDSNNGEGPFDFQFGDGSGSGSSGSTTTTTTTVELPVIQTDAAINPGNSGGALLNTAGELIGVNVAIASASSTSTDSTDQSGSIGVGFAIPSNVAARVAQEIMKNGKATHGLLGATVSDASDTKSSTVEGALIAKVSAGGGAASAGLKKGDIVTSFNGKPITGSEDLTAQVRALAAGASSRITYVRGGKTYTASVTLGTLPAS